MIWLKREKIYSEHSGAFGGKFDETYRDFLYMLARPSRRLMAIDKNMLSESAYFTVYSIVRQVVNCEQ